MSKAKAPHPAKALTRRIHDLARIRATQDLIENHRGEYDLLRQGWLDYLRQQEGWVDGRPQANVERHKNAAASDPQH